MESDFKREPENLDELCGECGKRLGEHYGDACPVGEILHAAHPTKRFRPKPEGVPVEEVVSNPISLGAKAATAARPDEGRTNAPVAASSGARSLPKPPIQVFGPVEEAQVKQWIRDAAFRIYIQMGGSQESFRHMIAEEYAKAHPVAPAGPVPPQPIVGAQRFWFSSAQAQEQRVREQAGLAGAPEEWKQPDSASRSLELANPQTALGSRPLSQAVTAVSERNGESAPQSEAESRKEFEAWLIGIGANPSRLRRDENGDYWSNYVDAQWSGWQAARARVPEVRNG